MLGYANFWENTHLIYNEAGDFSKVRSQHKLYNRRELSSNGTAGHSRVARALNYCHTFILGKQRIILDYPPGLNLFSR